MQIDGPVDIRVEVSDGKKSTVGSLRVWIQPQGNVAPVANGDFYVARMNEPVSLRPLDNDLDPNGDKLRLDAVSAAPQNSAITPNLDLGTITFQGSHIGTFTLTYTVSDGRANQIGVIRIDVIDAEKSAVPVAEDDLALLPDGFWPPERRCPCTPGRKSGKGKKAPYPAAAEEKTPGAAEAAARAWPKTPRGRACRGR